MTQIRKSLVAVWFGSMLAAACGTKLDGTYSDQLGAASYRFQKDGKVYVGVMGVEHELQYEVDGDKLKLIGPQGAGNVILTMDKDGAILGPMGVKLSKK